MTSDLFALSIDATDPERLARFWGGVLRWDVTEAPAGGFALLPTDDTRFRIRVLPTDVPKELPNRIHLDLTSTSPEDMAATVARALEHGGRHIDIGQTPEEGHVVLADPDGNELCVIPPGNGFLADCGFIGAINCDGSQRVGYFWSEALGWPLVWDQDEETAIQSPLGGTKMAWGGPPLMPKPPRNRLHLDLVPGPDGDQQAEVDRLLALGAQRTDLASYDDGAVVLRDPDGNEFAVLPPA